MFSFFTSRNELSNAAKKSATPASDQALFPVVDAQATSKPATSSSAAAANTQQVRSNKENSKPPAEVYIKKTRQYTMLEVWWRLDNKNKYRI